MAAANTIPAYILIERIIISGMCAAGCQTSFYIFGFSERDIICALKPVRNVKGLHFQTRTRSLSFDRNQNGHMFTVQLVSN